MADSTQQKILTPEQMAFEVMNDSAWIVGSDGRIQVANAALRKAFHVTRAADLVGHHVHEFLQCKNQNALNPIVGDDLALCAYCVARDTAMGSTPAPIQHFSFESIRRPDSVSFSADYHVTTLESNSKFSGCLFTFVDSTERWKSYELLSTVSPQVFWETDPNGRPTYVNQHWADFSGRSVEDTLRNGWDESIHPDNVLPMYSAWADAVARQGHYEHEMLFRRADGQYRWFVAKGHPLMRKDGSIERWVGVCYDIHDRKQKTAHLQSVLDNIPIMAGVLGPEGRMTLANEAARNSVSGTVEEQFQATFWEAPWWKDLPLARKKLKSAFQAAMSGEAQRFDINFVGVMDEVQVERWIDFSMRPLKDDKGQISQVSISGFDITDRMTAEKLARVSEQRLLLATEATGIGVWEIDPKTMQTWRTPSHDRAYGFPDLIKENDASYFFNFVLPEDHDKVTRDFGAFFATGAPLLCYYRVLWPNGEVHWLKIIGQAVRDANGEIVRMIGTNYDVTEQRRFNEELQLAKNRAEAADQAKSYFLANMSHEIRTPLGSILGFTDLLKGESLSRADQKQYLNTISRSGLALTRIIDDILDLAKVESGKLELENVEFSLNDVLEDVMALFQESVRAKGLSLTLIMPNQFPNQLVSDPARLRQILTNVVGNAIKFTKVGGVTLEVRTEPVATSDVTDSPSGAGQARFEIAVSDTGVGISKEQQERLFRPFMQADNSTSRKFGGTGLGLVLSERLAVALKGNIRIAKSVPGLGTTFVVTFVADVVEEPNVFTVPAEIPFTGFRKRPESTTLGLPLSGLKVLVVDDTPENQELVREILIARGAIVDVAGNGLEAVERALAGSHDIVLMDLQMPEMDGYQATKLLRDQGYPKAIVALTAHAMVEERRKTAVSGFDGHLIKPLDFTLLIDTVQQMAKTKSVA